MKIVAFTGYKGSGKTTAAQMLGYELRPFASTLKRMLAVLGLTDDQIYGSLKETPCDLLGGHTPRHAMQTLGTEWGRECIDPEIWLRSWKHSLPQVDIVVDDLRFPNEAQLLIDMGAKIVRVDRNVSIDLHPSEAFIQNLPVHHIIANNSNIDDLRTQVLSLK
jgi:hypothetical protein